MRASIISVLLAGGMLVLGACSTTAEPLTLAERTEQCAERGTVPIPTGRQTTDARQDYKCKPRFDNYSSRVRARTNLNSAVSQGLSRGY